jgi:hypothetical protein
MPGEPDTRKLNRVGYFQKLVIMVDLSTLREYFLASQRNMFKKHAKGSLKKDWELGRNHSPQEPRAV